MVNPQDAAAGSAPTVAAGPELARDATGRTHDSATGRFVRAEPGPRILARRAQVAALYPEWGTAAEIAAELGWSKSCIENDIRALDLTGLRAPGVRRKHPELEERECANPDCPERFTPASWEPDRRYCSHPCAIRATRTEKVREAARAVMRERRRRAEAEIARLNADGFLTSRQFAAERDVTESAVSQWIARGLVQAERRLIEGEPHRLVSRDQRDRFNTDVWPSILQRMGPGWPANWSRPAELRWQGRTAPLVAAKKGSRVGRPSEAEAFAEMIDDLIEKGWRDQDIADGTGLSRHVIGRYRRARRAVA